MPIVKHQGVNLHWGEQGEGSPLLLIMGHRHSSKMWYAARDALAGKHRVIWFDNRGTGGSGHSLRVTIAQLAADALAVLDAAGVARAHVYGVSMGGGIAQEVAVQQPARVISLTLGCTALWSAEKRRLPAIVRALYYVPFLLKLLLSVRRGDSPHGSAASAEAIARDLAEVERDDFSVLGVAAQAHAIAAHVNTREQIAALTMPALVMHGNEDVLVPFRFGEELAATLPNSRLVTLEGAGHNYYVAAAEKANRELLRFLDEVDAQGR